MIYLLIKTNKKRVNLQPRQGRKESLVISDRMNVNYTFLLAFLFLCLALPCKAKTYLGAGGTSCKEYLNYKRELPVAAQAIDFWILGYISGLNFANYSTTKVDLLIDKSSTDILGFVKGYCSAREQKTLNNAANEYYVQAAKVVPKQP